MIEASLRVVAEVLEPLTDPGSRTFAPSVLFAALLALLLHHRRGQSGGWRAALGVGLWRHASSILDAQLFIARQLLKVIGLIPVVGGAWVLAVKVATHLDHWLGVPMFVTVPGWLLTLGYTAVLFVVWDLSRFITHLALHKVDVLWAFHQVHHSGEVLTPLTFHRTHPVESLLYALRGTVTTGLMAGVAFWAFRGRAAEVTIMGVHGLGFLCSVLTGNLRHSHVWVAFPASVERWLMSPAQHQLHHSSDPRHAGKNLGTWLSIWDRGLGTLALSPSDPVGSFGLDTPNHDPHDLWSALSAPFVDAVQMLRPTRLVSAGVTLALLAWGGLADAADNESDADGSMIVTAEAGAPRVAGAAHVIDEETLERHEYTDIHQILATVPGVYLRDEDGFGLRPNIGLRGGNSDRSAKITLLEDGVPLAPAPYAAPAAYYFPIASRLVGVEVIKGAAAIRHGPQTIGGAVNLMTRRAPSRGTIAEIDTAYGAFRSVKAHGYAGHAGDHWGALGEVAHLSSQGFKTIDGGGDTGFSRQDAMLKTRFTSSLTEPTVHSVEIKLSHGQERSNETYLGLTETDFTADPSRRYGVSADDQMTWSRQGVAASWRLIAGDSVDVRATVYHHRLDRSWFKVSGFADGTSMHDLLYAEPEGGLGAAYLAVLRGEADSSGAGDRVMKGTNDRRFENTGVSTVAHWRTRLGDAENELEVGARYHIDAVDRIHTQRAYDVVDGRAVMTGGDLETSLDSHTRARALTFHLHDDLRLGMFSILPGLRFESIRTEAGPRNGPAEQTMDQSIWLPGMGVHAQPTHVVGIFAGAHRGFSPVPPGSAAETAPETAWNYEVGGRLTTASARAELVGFYSDYQNITGQCTLSGGCLDAQLDRQFSGGEAVVRGFEASAEKLMDLRVGWNLRLGAAYAWTDARFSSSFVSDFPQYGSVQRGFMLPYVPVHQGSGSLTLSHESGHVSATYSGRSGMRNQAGPQDQAEEHTIPSHHTIDLAGEVQVSKSVALYASVSNLTDEQRVASWRPFGARPSHPRQWFAGVKAEL